MCRLICYKTSKVNTWVRLARLSKPFLTKCRGDLSVGANRAKPNPIFFFQQKFDFIVLNLRNYLYWMSNNFFFKMPMIHSFAHLLYYIVYYIVQLCSDIIVQMIFKKLQQTLIEARRGRTLTAPCFLSEHFQWRRLGSSWQDCTSVIHAHNVDLVSHTKAKTNKMVRTFCWNLATLDSCSVCTLYLWQETHLLFWKNL